MARGCPAGAKVARNARPGISNSRAFRAAAHCSKTSSTALRRNQLSLCGLPQPACRVINFRGESTAWIRSLMPRRSSANPGYALFLRCHSLALLPSAPFPQSGSGCRAFRRRIRRSR